STPDIYTLSLHDALPICSSVTWGACAGGSFSPSIHAIDPSEGSLTIDYNATPPTYHGYGTSIWGATLSCPGLGSAPSIAGGPWRSEEHTSELQSLAYLVC